MKLATFFISRTKQIYAKTLAVSESAFKMKVMSAWILFELLQQLSAKKKTCMKTRLCNIFKTTNTKTLIKTISESPKKRLQTPWKAHRTVHTFFTGRSIFSYFLRLNCLNCSFRTALTKYIEIFYK